LGDNIGITLIATGFHHKDPFDRAEKPKTEEKKEEKIVMTLGAPVAKEKEIFHHQPTLLFEEPVVEQKPVQKEEPVAVKEELSEAMAPQLVEVKPQAPVIQFMPLVDEVKEEIAEEEMVMQEVKEFEPIHFELKVTEEPVNTTVAEQQTTAVAENKNTEEKTEVKVTSGGYLARPATIYAEENTEEVKSNAQSPVEEQPFQLHIVNLEEEAPVDMQLVVKTNPVAAEEPVARQSIQLSSSEEPPVITDEAEEQRKKAAERLQKLRNLSFNINAADANNEFDNVPAYLRRNMELYNTINTVENFYSNYTVKTDENNKTEISTVNTFLDGKKPD
jgi:cell division protein FtsZ